jgi:hypothetical protein
MRDLLALFEAAQRRFAVRSLQLAVSGPSLESLVPGLHYHVTRFIIMNPRASGASPQPFHLRFQIGDCRLAEAEVLGHPDSAL